MELTKKVALITGGARIGITVAEELAKAGCHVALTFRNSKNQALLAVQKVRNQGTNALIVHGDMTKRTQVERVVEKVFDHFGRLDLLINMVSIFSATPFKTISDSNWEENLAANLKSAHLCSTYCAPLMLKNGEGRIINFSDWVAASGRPRYKGFLPYYVSKTGVLGLTQALALELAPKILVNCIAPGPILAPGSITSREIKAVQAATPLKKWGGPAEIAKAVLFLAETDFVTGEVIRVDGGRHLF